MSSSTSNGTLTTIDYKPQLDGLRFMAVFVVVIYHFFPEVEKLINFVNSGNLLAFFFVLSSYLITKVLLRGKEKGRETGQSKFRTGFIFLIRRTLRIFPAYYFYLFLVFLVPIDGQYLRDHLEMFIFYISNFQVYADPNWNGLTGHIWTLAVEEQIYLIWPWLILFVPNKHLPKAFAIIIFLGISSRIVIFNILAAGDSGLDKVLVLTPTCLDCFGLGALLALRHSKGYSQTPYLVPLLVSAALLWTFGIMMEYFSLVIGMGRIFISLLAMVIIEWAVKGYQNPIGKFLENKYILYLGRISYGLYLYHMFALIMLWKILIKGMNMAEYYLGINLWQVSEIISNPLAYVALAILFTVVLAIASWHFVEWPVNQLKQYINYTSPKASIKKKQGQLAKQ